MRAFAALYERLDRSTATTDKRAALMDYLAGAPAADASWAVWLLSGGKVGGARARIATTTELRQWVAQASGTALWLVEDSYEQVGDLAETLTLLTDEPGQSGSDTGLAQWIEQRLLGVANAAPEVRQAMVLEAWASLPFNQRLVFNKLLTGSLRVGVSSGLVQQALARISGVEIALIAQRLLGNWSPGAAFHQQLLSTQVQRGDSALPYPFYLASPLEAAPDSLGAVDDWLLEWKWDGIRVQLIHRNGERALWSRGEERLDGRFPEVEAAMAGLGRDAVIDGELLAWADGSEPMPFTALQTRIARRKPGSRVLADTPVRVLAYDLLELDGQDLRQQPLQQRRQQLASLLEALDDRRIVLSPALQCSGWEQAAALRGQARQRGVEGLMLKQWASPYLHGRKRGSWWKWKIAPLTIDAVLIYAQAGHGRRSTLYTDYTFALWDGDALVPVAKAYSGLDDKQIVALDRWIRANTLERFGPVRQLRAEQVFELAFEGVNRSARHKSGIAVRFPRILRWRTDKRADQADALASLQALAR